MAEENGNISHPLEEASLNVDDNSEVEDTLYASQDVAPRVEDEGPATDQGIQEDPVLESIIELETAEEMEERPIPGVRIEMETVEEIEDEEALHGNGVKVEATEVALPKENIAEEIAEEMVEQETERAERIEIEAAEEMDERESLSGERAEEETGEEREEEFTSELDSESASRISLPSTLGRLHQTLRERRSLIENRPIDQLTSSDSTPTDDQAVPGVVPKELAKSAKRSTPLARTVPTIVPEVDLESSSEEWSSYSLDSAAGLRTARPINVDYSSTDNETSDGIFDTNNFLNVDEHQSSVTLHEMETQMHYSGEEEYDISRASNSPPTEPLNLVVSEANVDPSSSSCSKPKNLKIPKPKIDDPEISSSSSSEFESCQDLPQSKVAEMATSEPKPRKCSSRKINISLSDICDAEGSVKSSSPPDSAISASPSEAPKSRSPSNGAKWNSPPEGLNSDSPSDTPKSSSSSDAPKSTSSEGEKTSLSSEALKSSPSDGEKTNSSFEEVKLSLQTDAENTNSPLDEIKLSSPSDEEISGSPTGGSRPSSPSDGPRTSSSTGSSFSCANFPSKSSLSYTADSERISSPLGSSLSYTADSESARSPSRSSFSYTADNEMASSPSEDLRTSSPSGSSLGYIADESSQMSSSGLEDTKAKSIKTGKGSQSTLWHKAVGSRSWLKRLSQMQNEEDRTEVRKGYKKTLGQKKRRDSSSEEKSEASRPETSTLVESGAETSFPTEPTKSTQRKRKQESHQILNYGKKKAELTDTPLTEVIVFKESAASFSYSKARIPKTKGLECSGKRKGQSEISDYNIPKAKVKKTDHPQSELISPCEMHSHTIEMETTQPSESSPCISESSSSYLEAIKISTQETSTEVSESKYSAAPSSEDIQTSAEDTSDTSDSRKEQKGKSSLKDTSILSVTQDSQSKSSELEISQQGSSSSDGNQ